MSELPTREEVRDAWNEGLPMFKYDIVVHDYAYGLLKTADEWRDTINYKAAIRVWEEYDLGDPQDDRSYDQMIQQAVAAALEIGGDDE